MSAKQRDAYLGDKTQQLRNGYGVYVYDNKFYRYEGEWLCGKKHGHGKLLMVDGSYYEGEFQEGEIEGHGFRYNSCNNSSYAGQFHLGEFQGQGVMKYGDGTVYEGDWDRNMREGYGVIRMVDNSTYQGYLHNHRRHGEGTQIYGDGSRYDGDWVCDKRQGHGELRYADGTTYHGQWRNDICSGQGVMTHSSGIIYEGVWINGLPSVMATKLVIKESLLEVTQGEKFSVQVECHNDEGEIVPEMGRELQVTAGYQYFTAPVVDSQKTLDASSPPGGSGLFDMIEDVEETPIKTPFGYDIVSYPLVEVFHDDHRVKEELAEDIEEKDVDDVIEEEPSMAATVPPTELAEHVVETHRRASVDTTFEELPKSPLNHVEHMPPPLVATVRTDQGTATFSNLMLPVAPPMYRPFMIQEEEKKSKSRLGAKLSDESRVSSRKAKVKPVVETLAKPGEYVIMVEDVATPAFLNITLQPAFLLVKLLKQVKQPREKKVVKKGPNPRGKSPL